MTLIERMQTTIARPPVPETVPSPETISGHSVKQTLHIVVVSETLPPDINGVAMTMGRLITRLKQNGHRIDLVYPGPAGLEKLPSVLSGEHDTVVRGYPIPFYKSMRFGLSGTRTFLHQWRYSRPDVIHIVTEGPLGIAALLAARSLHIPVVSGFHTNFHQYTGHYKFGTLGNSVMKYLRWFHNKTDVTLTPTSALANELTDAGFTNARVLSRGVDTEAFSPGHRCTKLRESFGVRGNDPVLLYVGRVAPEKNIDLAIRAFERVKAVQSNARLIVVGDGPELQQVQNHPTQPIVCGSKTGKELARYYASADIFLFPSLSETFGNVTLEAMASGLAVVAFNYAAAKERISNKRNGIAVDLACESSYIDAVESLARQPLLTQSMGVRARSSVQKLSWDGISDTLVDIYNEMKTTVSQPA